MNTLVKSNVVAYRRRYVAVIAAITIGVAFLTATLFVGTSVKATLGASVGQTYSKADLVVQPKVWLQDGDGSKKLGVEELQRPVKDAAGVSETLVVSSSMTSAELGGLGTQTVVVTGLDGQDALFGQNLVEGKAPGKNQVTVNQDAAKRAGLKVGDQLKVDVPGASGSALQSLSISGFRADPQDISGAGYPALQVSGATAKELKLDLGVDMVLARLSGGSVSDLAPSLKEAYTALGLSGAEVNTPEEAVSATVSSLSGGTDVLTWVLGAFAGIALVVTVIVVANTFSVILAQRTRELALLRTLGARRGQIRRMVIGESLIVGLFGGLLGIVVALLVVWGGVAIASGALGLPYVTFGFSVWPLVVGLIVSLLVTVIASARPAMAATRVSPLAALRPQETVTARTSRGATRIVIGLLLVLCGIAAMYFGVNGDEQSMATSFAAAFVGGLLSFIGVLMLGTLLIPWTVRQMARPFGSRVDGRLAGLNALRHPQRTAAIGTALLLGVTLVVLMLVGATTARSTLNAELAKQYPVDLQVRVQSATTEPMDPESSQPQAKKPLNAQDAQKVDALAGVENAALVKVVGTTPACAAGAKGSASSEGLCLPVFGANDQILRSVMADGVVLPRPGSIAVGASAALSSETKITVVGGDGTKHVLPIDRGAAAPERSFLISGETAAQLGAQPAPAAAVAAAGGDAIWAKADDSVGAGELVQSIVTATGTDTSSVSGALPIRQTAATIIDTLLMVVSALLAVAVVIALIGVSNTLSLSVTERTRENSLLRALGLTKRQLRRMLALEAALIAGAAAVLGIVLGTVYGLVGARSATLALGGFVVSLPWLWLLVVLVVSVGAAVLASVWPARRAAKLSPVEGLAVE